MRRKGLWICGLLMLAVGVAGAVGTPATTAGAVPDREANAVWGGQYCVCYISPTFCCGVYPCPITSCVVAGSTPVQGSCVTSVYCVCCNPNCGGRGIVAACTGP
jgi:hypothetical protein